MKPRKHIYQHSKPPPEPAYQSFNNSANPSFSVEQPMPPPPPPPIPMGSSVGQSTTPPSLPQTELIAELIRLGHNPEEMLSPKQSSNPRQQGQEDLLKNLQAIMAKGDIAEILQKLRSPNDWPMAPPDYPRPGSSVSGPSSGNPGNRESVIRGPNPVFASAAGSNAGGAASFTNNGGSSQQEQDIQYANELQQHQARISTLEHQFHQRQQQQQQQFRIPTTNNPTTTNMQSSPFMRNQQSISQQSKSVLSLHHHHQQQNDPSYRQRLSHHLHQQQHQQPQQQQQHKSNAPPNLSSFANLSDSCVGSGGGGNGAPSVSAVAAASGSNSSTILDTSNNPSIFSHHTNKTSPGISSYTMASGGMAPRVPSTLMDTLSGGASSNVNVSGTNTNGPTSGIDINIHDTPPYQLSGSNINIRDIMRQKSIAKHHQHLRGHLKANNDKLKNYPWPNQQINSSASLSHVIGGGGISSGDVPQNQHSRSINSNNNTINNAGSMPQMKRRLTSPLASAISPPQPSPALSSMPKSLLNLAACSTSPPTTNNINTMTPNNRVTSQLQAARNATLVNHSTYNTGGDTSNPNNRQQSMTRVNSSATGSLIQKSCPSTSSSDSHLLQQMIARSSTIKTNQTNSTSVPRTNYSNFSLSSLLSDDQSPHSRSNTSNINNSNNGSVSNNSNPRNNIGPTASANLRAQNPINQPVSRRPPSVKSDDVILTNPDTGRDAYFAFLHERSAKARNSIVDTGGCSQSQVINSAANPQSDQHRASINQQQQQQQQDSRDPSSSEMFARKEIESALSQVENLNDLSLLYPPIPLSSNSQKQVNSLSAGLQLPGDVDILTDELKKIVQEGCNIIYECKNCCNLFRSLANLVKHKRSFCKDTDNDANQQFEITRRTNINAVRSMDLSVTKSRQDSELGRPVTIDDINSNAKGEMSSTHLIQSDVTSNRASSGNQKYNLRGKRVDVSSLTGGDMRAPRVPTRNRRETLDQTVANLTRGPMDNSSSTRQTNLSRLLQSQPQTRQPQLNNSALMGALSMTQSISDDSSAPVRDSSRVSSMREFYQEHARNSSLAKTILSENAKALNVDQAHMISRGTNNNNMQTASKRASGPKRKLLEDCIRKVKRDKLGPDDDNQGSSTMPNTLKGQHREFRDPLDMDDSGADSDALVMDLEDSYASGRESRRKSQSRSQQRGASSSLIALNSQSNSKLNSSSALLKALTRPVESRPNYGMTGQKVSEKPSSSQELAKMAPAAAAAINQETTCKSSLLVDATSGTDDQPQNAGSRGEASIEAAVGSSSPILDKFTCDSCNMDLGDHSALLEHIIEKHKTMKKIHPCIFCSLSFITLENVCRHIIDIHKKSKAQVSRLKDVVQSRSYFSEDFANCDDLPNEFKDPASTATATAEASKLTHRNQVKTRLAPDALSDLATTQQILDDTVALVSMAASPTKSTSPSKKTPSLPTRSSSRLLASEQAALAKSTGAADHSANQEEAEISQAGSETDDADSMIPSISDEQLAILEREEAEIEAERLRREQDTPIKFEQPNEPELLEDQKKLDGSQLDMDEQVLAGEEHHTKSLQLASSSHGTGDRTDLEQDVSIQESASSCGSQVWQDEYVGAVKHDSETLAAGETPTAGHNDDVELGKSVDEEFDADTQSTHGSGQRGRVSRGKQMIPPMRQASDDEDDDDDDEDDADEDDNDEDDDDEEDDNDGEDQVDEHQGDEANEMDSEPADVDNDDSWSLPDAEYPSYKIASEGSDDNDDDADDDNDADNAGHVSGYPEIESHGHRSRRIERLSPAPRRRASHGSSTKGESDLLSIETGDETANYDYDDINASHGHSRAASRAATTDIAAASRSKSKSASRDLAASSSGNYGGGASSASSSSGGTGGVTPSGGGGSGGGGGIMKLKIQLKEQPDEKRKVYRIVE